MAVLKRKDGASIEWNQQRDGSLMEWVLRNVRADQEICSIDLAYNHIGAQGAKDLALGLQGTNVTSIDLAHTNIGAEGARDLGLALRGTIVTSINLTGNDIGDQGAKDLGLALQGTNVTSLNLVLNNIGDQGAKDLGLALRGTNVTSIDLSNTRIGDQGAKDLALGLQGTNVTSIDLSNTRIGDQDAQEVYAILDVNKNQILECVQWSGLAQAQRTETFKEFIFKFAPTFKKYISENGITLGELYDLFQENPKLSEDPQALELQIIQHMMNKDDLSETEQIIASNKLIEFAIHHERFTKEIVTQYLEAARFKEAHLILSSLKEDVRATLFEDFVEAFTMHPCPENESENAGNYKSLLETSLRIYSNPEQRLQFLEIFTARFNDYGIKNTCALLLSEQPAFLREKLPYLIELIPNGFLESSELTNFYNSILNIDETAPLVGNSIISDVVFDI